MLYGALESTATNEKEQKLLAHYKSQIDMLNKQEERLAEIRREIHDIIIFLAKNMKKVYNTIMIGVVCFAHKFT